MTPSLVQLRRRAGVVVTLVGLAWLVIAGRLIQIQGLQQAELTARATRQRVVIEEVPPRPGDIYDAQGRLLATTIQAPSLYLVPLEIREAWPVAQGLAEALGLDADELYERIGRNRDKQFLWVERRLTEERAARVRALGLPPETHGFRAEYRRVYPQGPLAAQVLGLRDIDGMGRGGIEEQCDAILRGAPGKRQLTRDARGRVIDVVEDPAQPLVGGRDVHLTLDAVLQHVTEQALETLQAEWRPEGCCAIVLDPRTGDVLAMASRPGFDPNHPEAAPETAWKNRAIADIYEPGSTLKPLIVAYGLERELVGRGDSFDCEWGRYAMGRRLLHDHHPYGVLSLTDVLVKSSNIGMAKIGQRLGNEELHAATTAFGLGRPTGIELPGELPGILRPLKEWTSYSTGSIPMGHELATTPLQLIAAHAALANGGVWRRPTLLKAGDRDADAVLPAFEQAVVSPDVAKWVVEEPMQQVVARGTGRKAQLEGYSVFGKTGTAQALSPDGGYAHGKYISSFLCGAPVEAPELLVLVVINQAQGRGGETFGGQIAAPVAARILRESLVHRRISPDRPLPKLASERPRRPR
jgi:cell division protein FtsI/penicillin-binding protein 2